MEPMGRGGAASHVPTPPTAARPTQPKPQRPSKLGASVGRQIRSVVALAEQLARARAGRSTVALAQAHAAAACWWEDVGPNKQLSARIERVEHKIAALEPSGADADRPGSAPPRAPQQSAYTVGGNAETTARPSLSARRMLTALHKSKRQMEAEHSNRRAEALRRQRALEESELRLVQLNAPRVRDASAFELARFVERERATLFELWSWLAQGHTPLVFIGALQGSTAAIDALAVEMQIWSLGLLDLPEQAHASGAPMPSSCLEKSWGTFDAMQSELKDWTAANARVVRARQANLTARSRRRALGLRPSDAETREAQVTASEKQLMEEELSRLRQTIRQIENEQHQLVQRPANAEMARKPAAGMAETAMVKRLASHASTNADKRGHKHRMHQVISEALPCMRDRREYSCPDHSFLHLN